MHCLWKWHERVLSSIRRLLALTAVALGFALSVAGEASAATPAGGLFEIPRSPAYTVLCEGSNGTLFVLPGTAWRIMGRIKEGLHGLCGDYQVVRLNYRGVPFGKNLWKERQVHQAIVFAAIDSGERVALLGYSQGASMAMEMVTEMGPRRASALDSVVLVAPAGKVSEDLHKFAPEEISRMEARWNDAVVRLDRRLGSPTDAPSYKALLSRTVVILAGNDAVVVPEGIGHVAALVRKTKTLLRRSHVGVQRDPALADEVVNAGRPPLPASSTP